MRSPWIAMTFVAVLGCAASARAQSTDRLVQSAIAQYDAFQHASNAAQKEEAQYQAAIALYNLGLRVPAYGMFAEIADKPSHARFQDTLSWLATLSNDLPEPADVIERIGKYDEAKIALFDNAKQREIYWRLHYWHGRYAYRNRRYEDAITELNRVDAASPLFANAQFFRGMAHVQTRRSVPAAQAFQRVISWLDDGEHPDAGRLRDLANMSLARTYYSASTRIDADTNAPVVDAARLSASVKYYRRVDVAGDYFLDSLFEESWARYMAGDYAHALGNVRMLASPGLPARYPEAAVLEGIILYGMCRYDDANIALEKMKQTHRARRDALTTAIDALEKMDDGQKLRFLRGPLSPAVADATSDRMLAGHLAYVAYLNAEKTRFDQLPASFRNAKIADDVRDALALATDIAIRNYGQLATERLLRARDEIDEQLRNGVKTQIDIVAAQRNTLELGAPPVDTSPPPPKATTLSWPINGNVALSSFGAYRVDVATKCSR